MKKMLITILVLCLFASFGMAQHKSAAHKGGLPLNGTTDYVLTWDGLKAIWAAGGTGGWVDNGTDITTITATDTVRMVDNQAFTFGVSRDVKMYWDDDVDDQWIWETTATTAATDDDAIAIFLFPASPDADQELFEIAKGTQGSKTSLWKIDEDGDVTVAATMTLGSDIQIMGGTILGGNVANIIEIDADPAMFQTVTFDIKFNPNDGGGSANVIVGNPGDGDGLVVNGRIEQEVYVIRKHVALSGASDASATNWFTITTADETGSADGGMYSVHVHLTAGEATAASGAVNTASVGLAVRWTRIMASAGTGANSAVVEIGETASADEGSGAISAVTVTVTETSEFVQQVLLNVNTSGGTFDGFAMVEVVYSDFTTPPVIN